ncbi:MAG: D-inositol 3-phosphate glycosyltransferase [Planctomycetota bacterium]
MDCSPATLPFSPATVRGRLPRVVIDLEKLRHINCGLGRFSLYLGRELLGLAADQFDPVFFLPRGGERYFADVGGVRHSTVRVRPWRKEGLQRWLRPLGRYLPGIVRPDLWHVTNQMSRYLPLDDRVPVVLTIHDLNFLHNETDASNPSRIRRKLADIQRRVDQAAAITAVSQFTADDIRNALDVRDKPIHVIPNGLPPPPAAAVRRPDWLPAGPFAFAVGNFLPHKNFHVLLGLAERLPNLRLVIAGKKATPYGEQVERDVHERGLGDRVMLPGVVSDADRQWLYENCDVFLLPSLAEGFGFPALEAMQCGKPVVMSRRTSLPEIAGDEGFFFDSYQPEAMASVVETARTHFATDPQAADRCRRHAATFSWRATAEGYAVVYRSLLAAVGGNESTSAHRIRVQAG